MYSGYNQQIQCCAPKSLKDPNVGSRAKQWRKKKVGAHSLTRSTLKRKEHVGAPRWDQNKLTSDNSK